VAGRTGLGAFVRDSAGLRHRYYQAANIVLNSSITGAMIVLVQDGCADEDMYRVKLSHRGDTSKSDDPASQTELSTTPRRLIA